MPLGTPDDFGDQPWELPDGHMPDKAMVVDPVGAFPGIPDNARVFGSDTLPAAGEGGALAAGIKAIRAGEQPTGGKGPAIAIITSFFESWS